MELYHTLNRGVDKRDIFLDDRDRARFIHDLFEFNDVNSAKPNYSRQLRSLPMMDVRRPSLGGVGVSQKKPQRKLLVYIHAFCLMPNHYHLLLSPVVENGVSLFMKKLNGGYAKYFNERYERSGALFQGKYKSVLIERDAHFLYIPFYIHFNPLDLKHPTWREQKISNTRSAEQYLQQYRWSSHLDYLGIKNFPSITQREFLLDFFDGPKEYQKKTRAMLKSFTLEEIANFTLE